MRIKNPAAHFKLQKKPAMLEFRKENFEVVYHTWLDTETGESFTTDVLDEINIAQVHNQFRTKYGIPFVEEIVAIREQYGISAAKMGSILGLGANVYRNYELGEMPVIPTGKLIQLARDPEEFRKLIHLSSNELEPHELERIHSKVEAKLAGWDYREEERDNRLFGNDIPGPFTGYRKPSFEKIAALVKYYALHLKPFKTKLNKLLFYTDFIHYAQSGFGITGLGYTAIAHGPVPRNYGSLYDTLFEQGFIEIEMIDTEQYSGEKFLLHDGEPDMDIFTDAEQEAIAWVLQKFGVLNTRSVVDASHNELAWKDNIDKRGHIHYNYGFHLTDANGD
jgi:transcriptional regulator with XRE-family HTH domain